ncbi:L,D-transpeptidase family protein [Sphingobium aquiterrae]|uniref:L,D-transpeptidase family protein n=1 Tax=Sphingobium aquiterrae TaxID=2038656 RepID=UPI003017FE4A
MMAAVLLTVGLPASGFATMARAEEAIAPSDGEAGLKQAARSLSPGAYLWDERLVAAGPLSLHVSIGEQRLYVYRGGRLVAVSTVSTGMAGHRTPTGTFSILQKREWHRSNLYSNAPMPFMQRLTWGGIALHAGHNPGRPASHGCIRLPYAFARRLFGETVLGTQVRMTDSVDGTVYYLEVDDDIYRDNRAGPTFTPPVAAPPVAISPFATSSVIAQAPQAPQPAATPLVLRYDAGVATSLRDAAPAMPAARPDNDPADTPPPDPWNGTARPHWIIR